MIKFRILKNSKKSRARLGILETEHGVVRTPTFVPVATQAAIKTLTSEEVEKTKSQILITNTFHLHLRPGENIVNSAGGLHKFMNWGRPLMTDSGGFQVFSFGFGKDLGVGKVLKYFPGIKNKILVKKDSKPRNVKITEDGVYFRSPWDGARLFIGPKESIKIQEKLGANIIFAFDECTPPLSTFEYVASAVERTQKWAKLCIKYKTSNQAIYGIIQGSIFKELREGSAKFINNLEFDGFGIGGDLGRTKEEMRKILRWVIPSIDPRKPRHLLGIGHLEDIEKIIKEGIDTFDCIVPTHYGRRGIAFTSRGKLNVRQVKFLKDKNPLDKKCDCLVCQNYRRNYISHLLRAGEISALKMLTFHNLYFFNTVIEKIRNKIKAGKI